MKKLKQVVALVLVFSLISSFALVFALSAFPEHGAKHLCPQAGCAACAIVNFAQNLFRTVGMVAFAFGLLILLQARRFLPFSKSIPVKQINETPVTLKIKITG